MRAASHRYLQDYVAIPSLNPMGRADLPDDWVGEARFASHLHEQLKGLAVDSELVGSAERPSLIAHVVCRDAQAETVLVASHLDTVPVDGMEIAPFDPVIAEGRLSGRGSCDTKGGMAALMAALERVLERGGLRRNLILVGEADEELGSAGVKDVIDSLGTQRPDWVLATEPTEMRLVCQHKGVAFARLHAKGRACHASNPSEGHNALVSLSRAAVALDELAARLASNPDPDSELGPATLSIGQMGGGQAPNIVPDHGFLLLDRRLLPGETVRSIREELERTLATAELTGEVEIAQCVVGKPPLATPHDHASVACCRRALQAAGLPVETGSVAFGTDAGVFGQAGIPGVVMGPGSILRAHTSREYVELDQVDAMTEFLVQLLSAE